MRCEHVRVLPRRKDALAFAPYLILGHAAYSATYLADRTSASDQAKTIVANKACRSVRRVSIVARSASGPRCINVHIHNRPVDRRRTPPGALLTRRADRRQRDSPRPRPRPIPSSLRNNTAVVSSPTGGFTGANARLLEPSPTVYRGLRPRALYRGSEQIR